MSRSNENRLAEDARYVAANVAQEAQLHIGSFPRSNQNVLPEPATSIVPPASWGQDLFVIGFVSVGLLGLAYIVLKRD